MTRARLRRLHSLLLTAGFSVILVLAGCTKPDEGVGGRCRVNADCPEGTNCISGVCTKPSDFSCFSGEPCTADEQCGSERCRDNGCCAVSCRADTDCLEGEECRGGFCQEFGAACRASADCPYEVAPICDVESGACVRCLSDEHCPAGTVCQNNGCKSVTPPGGCASDIDCKNSLLKKCDTSVVNGRCVACLGDSDCSSDGTSVCIRNVCQTVKTRCDWNGDCAENPNGKFCAADGKCVQCLRNDNCPSGSRCMPDHTCQGAPQCSSDASCPADKPRCRPTDKFCVECYSNTHCPQLADGRSQICRSGYCVPSRDGCVSKSDCPATKPVCRTADRTCVGCITNANCGAYCRNEKCEGCVDDLECATNFFLEKRIFCNSEKACVECIGDNACDDDEICEKGRCVEPPDNKPCPADGQCIRDTFCVQDGTATGTCRTRCDVYSRSNNCTNGTACGILKMSSGVPIGACMPRVQGAAAIGATCSATKPCDVDGVCIPEGPNTARCYPRCDPNRSNNGCGAPNSCQWIVQSDASGAPVAIGACFPDTKFNDACATDGNCDPGQVCAANGNPSNPLALRNSCDWPGGTANGGEPCARDSDCRSSICLFGMPNNQGASGFCQGACIADANCPMRPDNQINGACELYPVPWRDRYGKPSTSSVTSCVPQCRDNSECPSSTMCDLVANKEGTKWATRCSPRSPTGSKLGGASCYQNSECVSGNCLTFGSSPAGICAGVCNAATAGSSCDGAAQCPPSGVILKVGPGPDGRNNTADDVFVPAPICWGKNCTADIQCGPANACGADPDPANLDDIILTCRPKQGAKLGGDTCASDGDCRSGWCVTWGGGSRCFGACDASKGNADCAGGAICHTGRWTKTTPNKELSYCAPP